MKKCFCWLFALISLCSVVVVSTVVYWQIKLPDQYKVERGENFRVSKTIYSEQSFGDSHSEIVAVGKQVGDEYFSTLTWCGIFPIKKVTVEVVDRTVVVLGGIPFGVKLYTDGVLIVSFSQVDTESGKTSPAQKAGLKVGDLIVSINGNEVYTNEEVAEYVKKSKGKPMIFSVRRNGVLSDVIFCAEYSPKENCYKAGLWVRDSSAGIGTVTFYSVKNNVLAGLGHPICDVDTGDILPISTGEIVPARIYSVTKSVSGSPGELQGGFLSGSLGTLVKNTEAGVYAIAKESLAGETLEIALKQEIKEGPAKVYTTISGNTPQWYEVVIRKVNYRDTSVSKNMIIEITDATLLDKTGGIVQGM